MALLLVLTIAGAGWWSIQNLSNATRDVATIGSALKSQQEADMMHDAIRGDVLAVMLAVAKGDLDQAAEVRKDEQAHAGQFDAALATLRALPLEPALVAAVEGVGPALKAYEDSAARLTQMAASGQEPGKGDLADFQKVFGQVEDAMGNLSELIESRSGVYVANAERLNALAN